MMTDKISIGVVGAGWPAWQHIKGYQKLEAVEVVALCDANAQRLEQIADEYQVPQRYVSYDEMLKREDLDVVSVCTPPYLHAEMTIKALQKGKHVLCEKPMAHTSASARQMLAAGRQTDKVFMIGHMFRFGPQARALKNMVDAGDLGEIYLIRTWWVRRSGVPAFGWYSEKDKSGGGALIDIGVHMLDLALWMLGFPAVQHVSGSWGSRFGTKGKGRMPGQKPQTGDALKFEVEDFATAHVKFDNDCTLMLHCSWASHVRKDERGLELWGDKAGAKLFPLEIFTEQDGQPQDIVPEVADSNAFDAETRHFVECIRNGARPICLPEEGYRTIELIEKIYQAGP